MAPVLAQVPADSFPEVAPPWVHCVKTKNFRGHATTELQLKPGSNLFIGPGDSGKSTMLTAIEYALWPLYALSVTDNDFHMGTLEQEILIDVWGPAHRWRCGPIANSWGTSWAS